jgi:pSer/pThr/pTyr-binding forkhead associated (FHA) protein
VHIVQLEKPSSPYIILQKTSHESISKDERHYVVIPGNGTSAKIGRSHDVEIKLQDITISRKHAEIFYRDEAFYLKDLGSKFGTLLKL